MPRLWAVEKEEVQVRGRQPGQDTPTRTTGLQLDFSFRESWQVGKPVKEAMLLLFVFPEFQRHQGPMFPRHPPYRVFKSISDTGKGLTAGRGTNILCRAFTQKRGHSCSTKAKSNFLVQCLKKNKKHILKTQSSSTKAQAPVGGKEFPTERATQVRMQLGERRPKCKIPAALETGSRCLKWQHSRLGTLDF